MKYNFRILSASNKDLKNEVSEGLFREDLFYRIFSVDIYIPPLRERREDIVPLTVFFINTVCNRFMKKDIAFSSGVLSFFEDYPWPGNVRQLLHEVERLIALTPDGESVSLHHCSEELQKWRESRSVVSLNASARTLPEKVRELEIRCIQETLQKTGGNKLRASKLLGITRPGLDKKLKRYNIRNSPKSN